ncbi:MAG: ATP-dependent RecD-like DNA helicase [Lachnospiraceae bacterium]|nr:ATP-dependent RecD-like DNA helicase [Lachnospiraceae bacterium]
MSDPVRIRAYIEQFIFRSADTGYGVANLVLLDENSGKQDDSATLTAVGTLSDCSEGDTIEAEGTFTVHPVYGEQFRITSYRMILPTDAVSVERYLASGAIKGIGKVLAKKIVKRFGDDTFRIMEDEPERLSELKGISPRMAREIGIQMKEKHEQRELAMFLQDAGITGALAVKVIARYKDDIRRVLKENPYKLAEEIDGVGFRRADEIARRMGISADAEFRVESGLMYALEQAGYDGHMYLPEDVLTERTLKLLNLEREGGNGELIYTCLRNLAADGRILAETGYPPGKAPVYDRRAYREECNAAALLTALAAFDEKNRITDEDIDAVERELDITLDAAQRQAVRDAVSGGVLILTGGPGTGKTTTMGAILRMFIRMGKSFVLAAPTGRAAKRMTEATGFEAGTIHRLLEVSVRDSDEDSGIRHAYFNRNEDNRLEADAVLIDEMSMVDNRLFCALLKAISPGTHLILIGDAAQLPSVGPGQVLHDLIDSHRFKVVALTNIFRQAAESDIVVNAHRINDGEIPIMDNKSRDFFFMERNSISAVIGQMVALIKDRLPDYVKAPPSEIQVLTPMRKGALGADQLNNSLQQALNPGRRGVCEWREGDRIWREGDRVMQIKNDYSAEWVITGKNNIVIDRGTGLFNGDMGVIKKIDNSLEEVTVEFDERKEVRIPFSGMEDLDLAYATTIHKSQGSEYPAVVIPLLGGPPVLLNRNLLYTAVTRAKKCVVILGNRETVVRMVENAEEMKRYTGLVKRLEEL